MYRLTYLLRRSPDYSFEDFQNYWREVHGPLVSKHATTLKIVRYVQVHTVSNPDDQKPAPADSPRGQMLKPYDGVAELWFRHRDDVVQAMQSTEGQAAQEELLQDERKFIDLKRSPGWFCYELPQINPTPENIVADPKLPIYKTFYVLNHHADQTLQEAQLYWRMYHGPLVRSFGQAIGALRYVQVHRLEDDMNQTFAAARGTEEPPFCGHAELWHDRSSGSAAPTAEAIRAGQALAEDESIFIDFARSSIWYGKEHVLVDGR
jgi:uncharacterized protein (TIGR02118 family)|tara:strand:- start:1027 stop:1815 length:789 start_codon:yes stop_codon:yes gene_type:complete